MAILLEKTLDNGITAEYWKIVQLSLGCENYNISGMVALYKDAEARSAGKSSIPPPVLFNYNVSKEEWVNVLVNPVEYVYNLLKENELNGGKDA